MMDELDEYDLDGERFDQPDPLTEEHDFTHKIAAR